MVSLVGDPARAADRLGRAAADVDVVIDYTWGTPTELAIPALLAHRAERSTPLDWIQIGSMAGQDITLPSFVLRAASLRIMGSGQGSLTAAGIIAELPSLIEQLTAGTLTVAALPLPLDQVDDVWTAPTEPGRRIVPALSALGRTWSFPARLEPPPSAHRRGARSRPKRHG